MIEKRRKLIDGMNSIEKKTSFKIKYNLLICLKLIKKYIYLKIMLDLKITIAF